MSARSTDWDEAAVVRDLYEQRKGIDRGLVPLADVPRFAEFAERYLRDAMGHLAASTREEPAEPAEARGSLDRPFWRSARR